MLLLLTYSALIIPMELAYSPNNPCRNLPTFKCDLIVDILFLAEIPYRFIVGVETSDGRYLDRLSDIAKEYSTDPWGFAFDFVTSIPFSWIEYAMMRDGCSLWPSDVAVLRLLKPASVPRHLRVLRAAPRLAALRDSLVRRAGLAGMRCARLFVLLLVTMHYFACGFWRLKWQQSETDLADYLLKYNLHLYDVADVYCFFLYFVSTTLTTIGYGDVVPQNRSTTPSIHSLSACRHPSIPSSLSLSESRPVRSPLPRLGMVSERGEWERGREVIRKQLTFSGNQGEREYISDILGLL
jgi:hypothetical protein